MIPGTLEEFVAEFKNWANKVAHREMFRPAVSSEKLPKDLIQPYADRYINIYSNLGSRCQALTECRTRFWQDYKKKHLPKYMDDKEARNHRAAFIYAMDTALNDFITQQGKNPYDVEN